MKNLSDYKSKRVQIHCKNKAEFYMLIPLLNKVFSGWNKKHWDDSSSKNGLYIDMYNDSCDDRERKDFNYAIIPAKEFLEEEKTIQDVESFKEVESFKGVVDYLTYEKALKLNIKLGDKLKRIRGEENDSSYRKVKVGDTFTITRMNESGIYDEFGDGHNYDNCMLVSKMTEIINNYEIY